MHEKISLPIIGCEPKYGAEHGGRMAVSRQQNEPRAAEARAKVRIAVADAEVIFRLGLREVLMTDAKLDVVADLERGEQLASEIARLQPDVLFIQHEMLLTAAALASIRESSPGTKLVVTASKLSQEEAVALVEAGVRGAIQKTAAPALFIKCAHKVAEGEIWLPKKQVAEIARRLSEHGARPVDTLTTREKLVISCLVEEGWRNRDIARHLSISEQTVKNHLRSIYDKVGVSDRLELVLYAIHQHLELPSVTANRGSQARLVERVAEAKLSEARNQHLEAETTSFT